MILARQSESGRGSDPFPVSVSFRISASSFPVEVQESAIVICVSWLLPLVFFLPSSMNWKFPSQQNYLMPGCRRSLAFRRKSLTFSESFSLGFSDCILGTAIFLEEPKAKIKFS